MSSKPIFTKHYKIVYSGSYDVLIAERRINNVHLCVYELLSRPLHATAR